ncbi:hypothetical protein ABFS82_04G070900 [Erythranthe guttata]|uniref:SHSP domain-containing protein n=1 Tax=Erythranthe guttata TaxID=4155 RepID=A0A022S479_ERYGU|nr:PREDICTED: inactive protein RESTRICTED TEV MOVEMENT 2 [Erythranthe guttata]EYU46130.1 hypothetical protein MIMGU_mgv1a012257mg [Erythranthe guttata]|eukprot:XP_012836793.1 PREDICTED: inactive protein RESTRICTED TEV MOVEMENT 2 [Erythranthe guttata]
MDAKIGAAATHMTNNFEPSFDWVREEECDTLLIYLPGFTKEQLRVQLTRTRILKISGARPLGDNKWSSFHKDFDVSENCDTNKITAKFEEGILYVRQPKVIVPAGDKEAKKIPPPPEKTTTPPQISQLPAPAVAEHSPPPPKVDQRQETAATPHEDFPEKSDRDNKDNVIKPANDGERSRSENASAKKDERKYAPEKNGKHGKIISGNNVGAEVVSPAAKLKKVRERSMMVMAVLFAFAFGMIVSNLGWFTRKTDN